VISIECFGEGWWKEDGKNFAFKKEIQEIYCLITNLRTMLADFQ
jgi:hypothetical protein